MGKMFRGLRHDGRWEEFEWDQSDRPTPESTGYQEVEDVDDKKEDDFDVPYDDQFFGMHRS